MQMRFLSSAEATTGVAPITPPSLKQPSVSSLTSVTCKWDKGPGGSFLAPGPDIWYPWDKMLSKDHLGIDSHKPAAAAAAAAADVHKE